MPIPSGALVRTLAPEGRLRASINAGNPVLAHRDAVTGEAGGVSVNLARALGRELDLGVELVVFDRAAQSVDAVRSERADVGFFAIDPARSQGLRFTAPYVLIEGSYLVPQGSSVRDNAGVDRPGTRVAVGQGSAYDLFLSRELDAAQVDRVTGAPAGAAGPDSRRGRRGRRHPAGARGLGRAGSVAAAAARPLHGDQAGHGPAWPTVVRRRRRSWPDSSSA